MASYHYFGTQKRWVDSNYWRRASVVWEHQGQNQWQENKKAPRRSILRVRRIIGRRFRLNGGPIERDEQIPQSNPQELHQLR